LNGLRAVIVADGEVDWIAFSAALVSDVPGAAGGRVHTGSVNAPDVARHAIGHAMADRVDILVIGADGGARRAEAFGRLPDLIVGDADSLSPEDVARYRGLGVRVVVHPAQKDESDLELCIAAAIERGAVELRICGALGGARIEHGLANVALLASPTLDGRDVAVLHRASVIRRIGTADGPGAADVHGSPRDYVSLLPLDPAVHGVTTHGLRYRLRNEALTIGPTRGLSNELTGAVGRITTERGRLVVIHTPRGAALEEDVL
jgi:thiamine pyrophosphokinase